MLPPSGGPGLATRLARQDARREERSRCASRGTYRRPRCPPDRIGRLRWSLIRLDAIAVAPSAGKKLRTTALRAGEKKGRGLPEMRRPSRLFVSAVLLAGALGSIEEGGQAAEWQSTAVFFGPDRRLVYSVDDEGNRIPDFSNAGYAGGGVPIPFVPDVVTIGPVPGDNTANVQAAIDEVGALPRGANGFRGAVLMSAGLYPISGTVVLGKDGVVLRGVGDADDPASNTILLGTGDTPTHRTVLIAGGGVEGIEGKPTHTSYWRGIVPGTRTNVATGLVPVGSRSFDVVDASPFRRGDNIILVYPASPGWLAAVDFGGTETADCTVVCAPADCPSPPWGSEQNPITFNRTVTAVSGNTLFVDAPVFNTLDAGLSQAYVYEYDRAGLVTHVGIESLRVDIQTTGGVDEAHAWTAIGLYQVEDAWVLNCTTLHFALSGVRTATATRVTVENCQALDPVAAVAGGRMYNFDADDASQLILFRKCLATNGRHHFVSNGASLTSGIVFLDVRSSGAWDLSEGHRRWSTGLLYDNFVALDGPRPGRPPGLLGLYSRGCYGPSQGWSAAHSVVWGSSVAAGALLVQKPPTAQNWAIGCSGTVTGDDPPAPFSQLPGYIEGTDVAGLVPRSLYEAQLAERLGLYQVPVVVDVRGADASHFRSDLTVSNAGASNASVVFSYLPAPGTPGAGGRPVVDSVPAGRELRIPDVVEFLRERGYAFPTDGTPIAGTLEMRFAEFWDPQLVAVSSRVSTPNPDEAVGGSFGLSFPAMRTTSASARRLVGDSSSIYGLREDAAFRSNLAIVDVPDGTGPSTLSIQLYDGDTGRAAGAPMTYTLGAGEWKQFDSILGFEGLKNGYAVVTKVGGGTDAFLSYGVVNDGGSGGRGTSDGSFIEADATPGLVPAVLRVQAGPVTFTSELILVNPKAAPVDATLTYTPSPKLAPGPAVSTTVRLGAGVQLRIPDVISYFSRDLGLPVPTAFGQGGTLLVSGAVALVRTSNPNADPSVGGTFGLGYGASAVSSRAAVEAWVFGLRQDSGARSNVAIADARVGDGRKVSYRVELYDSVGGGSAPVLVLGPYPLAGGEWFQVNGVLAAAGLEEGYVRVRPEGGSSDFVVYGVVNDGAAPGRGTSDGSFVAMSGVR